MLSPCWRSSLSSIRLMGRGFDETRRFRVNVNTSPEPQWKVDHSALSVEGLPKNIGLKVRGAVAFDHPPGGETPGTPQLCREAEGEDRHERQT